jgi:hypothetical protein
MKNNTVIFSQLEDKNCKINLVLCLMFLEHPNTLKLNPPKDIP